MATQIEPIELIDLPFLIFIYIADIERQLSANEVEQFNELISDRGWCKSALLKEVLARTESQYDRLWKDYASPEAQSQNIARLKELSKRLADLEESQYNLLRRDLIALGKAIAKASSRRGIISQPKESALITIENLLAKRGGDHPEEPKPKPEPIPPLPELWPLSTLITEAPPVLWKRGKIELICNKIINETHDVKTFSFISAGQPILFLYKPGQFLSLELQIDGKKVVRSYTISSTPSKPFNLTVTVKRVRDGLVSNWLHNHLNVGDKIQANGPHGKFNCFDAPARKLLLISGGSGITPVMSILRWLCDTGSKADIVFIHNAQTPRDIIFADELKLLSAQNQHLRVALCVSRTNMEAWGGYIGRFSAKLLEVIAPDFFERTLYVCGPEPYMEAVQHIVQNLGFDMNRYHAESFGKPPGPVPVPTKGSEGKDERTQAPQGPTSPPPVPEPPKRKTILVFKQQKQEATCSIEDTILDTAEAAGIDIPYACRAGSCGTCKVLKLEGEVEMTEASGLSADELSQGFVLACSTRAKGRVVLDI